MQVGLTTALREAAQRALLEAVHETMLAGALGKLLAEPGLAEVVLGAYCGACAAAQAISALEVSPAGPCTWVAGFGCTLHPRFLSCPVRADFQMECWATQRFLFSSLQDGRTRLPPSCEVSCLSSILHAYLSHCYRASRRSFGRTRALCWSR